MVDFGPIEYFLNQELKNTLLIVESQNPQLFYLFQKKSSKRLSNNVISNYYVCKFCSPLGNAGSARATVQNERFVTDPMIGHLPGCNPKTRVEIEGLKLNRETRKRCSEQGIAPLRAFRESVAQIPNRFPLDQQLQEEIEIEIGSYKKNRSSLYRQLQKTLIPILDHHNLPIEYRLTLRGREAHLADNAADLANERLLLYQEQNFLVFCSDLDLETLYQSEYWIMDGTFEMCPKPFTQLYTIHGFKNGEGVPLCFALLPSKQRVAYEQLFRCLIDSLIARFNEIGALHTIIMDFESAAMQACRRLLPANINIRGCLFHFGQCLMRWLQSNGLKAAYEDEGGQLRPWVHLVKACSMLPPNLVRNAWVWLREPPEYEDQLIRQKLTDFVTYFENTWLRGQFDVPAWNHFHNLWIVNQQLIGRPGPRTTNHAEGWHNKINQDFGHPHPALNSFLNWFQQTNHLSQVRIRQLNRGAQPKQRVYRYIQVDENIMRAKNLFVNDIVGLQGDDLDNRIRQYMDHIVYFLG